MDHPVIIFLLGYVSSCTFIFLNLFSKINSLSPLIIFIDLPWIFSRMMAPVRSWNTGAVGLTYCQHPWSGSAGVHKYSAQSMPADFCLKEHLFPTVCETQPNNLHLNHLTSYASASDSIRDTASVLVSVWVHFPVVVPINVQDCMSVSILCSLLSHTVCQVNIVRLLKEKWNADSVPLKNPFLPKGGKLVAHANNLPDKWQRPFGK